MDHYVRTSSALLGNYSFFSYSFTVITAITVFFFELLVYLAKMDASNKTLELSIPYGWYTTEIKKKTMNGPGEKRAHEHFVSKTPLPSSMLVLVRVPEINK